MAGTKIRIEKGNLVVPNDPIIPFIEGDGIGVDIWAASVKVFDAAVEKAYNGKKKIVWKEVYAGEKAFKKSGKWLPEETMDIINEYLVAITLLVGKIAFLDTKCGGIRSVQPLEILAVAGRIVAIDKLDGIPQVGLLPRGIAVSAVVEEDRQLVVTRIRVNCRRATDRVAEVK